jgi:hypothetical protein
LCAIEHTIFTILAGLPSVWMPAKEKHHMRNSPFPHMSMHHYFLERRARIAANDVSRRQTHFPLPRLEFVFVCCARFALCFCGNSYNLSTVRQSSKEVTFIKQDSGAVKQQVQHVPETLALISANESSPALFAASSSPRQC